MGRARRPARGWPGAPSEPPPQRSFAGPLRAPRSCYAGGAPYRSTRLAPGKPAPSWAAEGLVIAAGAGCVFATAFQMRLLQSLASLQNCVDSST